MDLFQQSRLLVNGVSIGIKLWPSLDAFRLLSDSINAEEKVQIVDVRFKLCVQRSASKWRGLGSSREALSRAASHLSLFTIRRSEIKTTSIAPAQYGFSVDDIFQGLVPNKLVVGLVSSAAYRGDYSKSPLYFQPYDCSSVGLYSRIRLSLYNQTTAPINSLTLFRKGIDVSRDDCKEGYMPVRTRR